MGFRKFFPNLPKEVKKEVQLHGFTWEKDILLNVFKATNEELNDISYTNKIDLPSKLNKLGDYDVSVKTTKQLNSVCMADCLRLFNTVSSGKNIHMVVLFYKQIGDIKKLESVTEIDLTSTKELLFGDLTYEEIKELDRLVKLIPQKRSPTLEEHQNMYILRNLLQKRSKAILLNIKCDSTQSRLQCSFNKFSLFIKENSSLIIEQNNTNELHGEKIKSEILSSKRTFK